MPQVCAEKTGYQHISIHSSMVCMGMSLVFVFNLSLDVPFFFFRFFYIHKTSRLPPVFSYHHFFFVCLFHQLSHFSPPVLFCFIYLCVRVLRLVFFFSSFRRSLRNTAMRTLRRTLRRLSQATRRFADACHPLLRIPCFFPLPARVSRSVLGVGRRR